MRTGVDRIDARYSAMDAETLLNENAELRRQLEEAEETVRAIQSGAVDAVVIAEPTGHRVYTLEGADRPYRLMVEQMQQGAATLQSDGTIAFCNLRLADFLAVPHEMLVGRTLRDFVVEDDLETYDQLFDRGRADSAQGEARLRTSAQRVVPAYFTFNILPLGDSAAVGLLVTDLTAQRHHERLTEFIATLAHELRGPLAPLNNMLQVMKMADGDAPLMHRACETMERQLRQMVRLVDDLLDVNRISRGKIELQRERIALSQVLERALEACGPLIEKRRHAIYLSLPTDECYLDGDPVRLAQVFGNLINNACKYMEPGGNIWVTATCDAEGVSVRVRDSGLGIPADKLENIFEIFSQVEDTLKRAQGGLGIGLSLVRRLTEMHGGTVEATSDGLGAGSEFLVRLPLAPAPPAALA